MSQIQALTQEQTAEIAMVDLAYMILEETKEAVTFQGLMNRIAEIKKMSQEHLDQMIVQIYTEINLDGRFVNVGDGNWGLKKWYPIEQFDDTVHTTTKSKRKSLTDDDYEDLEDFDLDEDFVDEFEDDVFGEDDEIIGDLDEDLVDDDDVFLEDKDVDIEFDSDDESLEELAEEEDIEDEEI